VKRLVVVGGGISGLAAAHAAAHRLAASGARAELGPIEIVLLEREERVGGKARTAVEDGFTVEWGPTGFLAPDAAIARLVHVAGLDRDVLPADAAAARRFIVRGGRLREVSAHPLRFARAGILGPVGLLRLLCEPLVPGRRSDQGAGTTAGDESVWDFARRRIGRQAADRLIAPMVLGVYAGDAKRISLPAAFPRLAALEAEHGSLVRGMLARRRASRRGGSGGSATDGGKSIGGAPHPSVEDESASRGHSRAGAGDDGRDSGDPTAAPAGPAGSGPAGPAGHLTSFWSGMETLPAALAAAAPSRAIEIRCGARVRRLERGPGGELRIDLASDASETLVASAVVLACEAWVAADLLDALAPALARELRGIAYPPVAVVALGYAGEDARRVPRGFGALIPRGEGYRALGVLWDSSIYPGRSPPDTALVRLMIGGAVDPEGGTADDATLVGWARADLRRLHGIEAPPVFVHVKRWERAIPQYELGHRERVRAVAAELERQPGLFLAGNALHGIAFGKAAEAGIAAGEAAAEHLRAG
jgi:oxygen-dependent protoporphyrinogen oxidase